MINESKRRKKNAKREREIRTKEDEERNKICPEATTVLFVCLFVCYFFFYVWFS